MAARAARSGLASSWWSKVLVLLQQQMCASEAAQACCWCSNRVQAVVRARHFAVRCASWAASMWVVCASGGEV